MKLAILFGLLVCFAVANGKQYDHEYPSGYPKEEQPGPVEETPEPYATEPPPVEETGGEAGGENGGEDGDKKGGEEKPPKEHPEGKMMAGDTDAEKHKGYCHWEIGVWMKPGVSRRCGCMKCDCKEGGVWNCNYNFAYCPYFYCGNLIFNPHTQICCCGKVHDKKEHNACCGYYYYDKRHSKCCNYYSVRAVKSHCPRHRV